MPKGVSKSNNNWTVSELNIVKTNLDKTAAEISKLLPGRTPKAIKHICLKNGLVRDVLNNWTEEELDLLRQNAENMKLEELKKLFPNRTEWAIKHAYNGLGLDRRKFAGVDKKTFTVPVESKNLAYFYGVLSSDGWTEPKTVRLSVKDEEFAFAWADIGKKLFGLDFANRVRFRSEEKSGDENYSDLYEVMFNSVALSQYLGSFRKINWFSNRHIQFVKNNKEFAAEFLSGYFDSDGCIFEPSVMYIAVSTKYGQNFIVNLLKLFGDGFAVYDDRISIHMNLKKELKKHLNLRCLRKKKALKAL